MGGSENLLDAEQVDAGKMSRDVYNMVKLCGLAGVLSSPNAECVLVILS